MTRRSSRQGCQAERRSFGRGGASGGEERALERVRRLFRARREAVRSRRALARMGAAARRGRGARKRERRARRRGGQSPPDSDSGPGLRRGGSCGLGGVA